MRFGSRFGSLVVIALVDVALADDASEAARGRRLGFSWRTNQHQRRRRQQQRTAGLCAGAAANSCASARNGVCEDGSAAMALPDSRQVHKIGCDLGTDCDDCAAEAARFVGGRPATLEQMMPRPGASPSPWSPPPGPSGVALLRARGVTVNAAWTRTQPPFLMPFTDPKADIDVSRMMMSSRTVEPLYNLYWHRLSAQCCAAGGLMLDVGANFGYYSLLAAKMGCRVVAWEPVPVFRAFVEAALRLNNLTHRVHLRGTVVSDVGGRKISMTVPEHGIWGTASVGGLNVDPSIPSPTYKVEAVSETLDQLVTEQPCIMKLDVEGYEPSVLKGAAAMLRRYPPRAILTEYTPGVIERLREWKRLAEYPASLRQFQQAGYKIWHLFGTSKGSDRLLRGDWSAVRRAGARSRRRWPTHAGGVPAARALARGWPSREAHCVAPRGRCASCRRSRK